MGYAQENDEYEDIAQIYEKVLGPLLLHIRREVCHTVQIKRFKNVIDICCGTGQQCIMLARLGIRVSGVDLSSGMLQVAKRESPSTISYYRANATALPFGDRTFDCAVLSFSLHEKSGADRDRIIAEAARVLTPDGNMVLVDYLSPACLSGRLGSIVIDFVERLAGKTHHSNYRTYMREGALESVLKRHRLTTKFIRRFHIGATALALVERRP